MWGAHIRTLIARALITLALVESAWLAYPLVRARVLALEDTPAARGRRVAASLGCFGCHGPDGNGGTRNPGSEEGTVPALTGQTQMMFVKTADDLREYVLDGAPRRTREDPDYRAGMEPARIRMPPVRRPPPGDQDGDLRSLRRPGRRPRARRLRALDPCRSLASTRALTGSREAARAPHRAPHRHGRRIELTRLRAGV